MFSIHRLVGDIEARELLSKDLASAAAVGRDNLPLLKSWQRATGANSLKREDSVQPMSNAQSSSGTRPPVRQRGFDLGGGKDASNNSGFRNNLPFSTSLQAAGISTDSLFNGEQFNPTWPIEDELLAGSETSPTYSNVGGDGSMDLTDARATSLNRQFSSAHSLSVGGSNNFSTSPRHQRRKLDNEFDSRTTTGGSVPSANVFTQQKNNNQSAIPNSILHTGAAYYNISAAAAKTSPDSSPAEHKSPENDLTGSPGGKALSVSTGTGTSRTGQPEGPLSELADVIGQLSLDENKEVRYHGRSSGLYLISKSSRYQDFFWRFPKAGVWPPIDRSANSDSSVIRDSLAKSEEELVSATKAYEVMPDKRTSDHLLELYWTYVHPHMPLLYRSLFVRQYRNTVHGEEKLNTATSTHNDRNAQSGIDNGSGSSAKPAPALAAGGKVPAVLLLAVYALAARYSDTGEGDRKEGEYWRAGERYASKAKEILYEDFGASRVTTCQALVLLAYRDVGVGAMARSWTYLGMAVRMAQDLGLFRDVDKWFLPVNAFGYEEKQTRYVSAQMKV